MYYGWLLAGNALHQGEDNGSKSFRRGLEMHVQPSLGSFGCMLYFLALPRCATPTRCIVLHSLQKRFFMLASTVRLQRIV